MMTGFTLLLAVMLLGPATVAKGGPVPVLTGDGGFEQLAEAPWGPGDWAPSGLGHAPEGTVTFAWDDSVRHGGEHAVSIAIAASHPDDSISYNWTRAVPDCQVGRTHQLSGWVRAENLGDTAWIVAQCWSADNGGMLGFATTTGTYPVKGTADWTPVWTVFTVPEGTAEVRLRAGISTPACRGGRVWFDDIAVREWTPGEAGAGPAALAGDWAGTLDAGVELRLVLHVAPGAKGWDVSLDSIDQGANGLGVRHLSVVGDEVGFELTGLPASFSGRLVAPDRIDGSWRQGRELPLAFVRTTEAPQLVRPQEPQGPFPYRSEDVAYGFDPRDPAGTFAPEAGAGGDDRITLHGTLTLPAGAGPHPAVLLITGSGPQDRDEALMGHKPFLVLADHLTRRGLAVLRVDDRGTGRSTGDFAAATTADFAADAQAGFRYLRQRADIAGDRVALLGHSEGGLIAPLVAVSEPTVAGIVLMAGPGVDGREVLLVQQQLMLVAEGVSGERLARYGREQHELLDLLGGDLGPDALRAELETLLAGRYENLSETEKQAVGSREAFLAAAAGQLDSPWMRWFLEYDPAPTLARVGCPVLAVFGGRDLQVDPGQNVPAVAAALAQGATSDYTVVELAGLNHLFQHAETGAVSEYTRIEETLAPEFLDLVTAWLQQRLDRH